MTVSSLNMPTLHIERQLLAGGANIVAGIDEVGRGALAGVVSIGIVLIDADIADPPPGLRDSKGLTAAARERLVPLIKQWALASCVANASAMEIDKLGIIGALRLAAHRGLIRLGHRRIDTILLDGTHNWLTGPAAMSNVVTQVKGDQLCASIAAASVLAKVSRDAEMVDLARAHPEYGFDQNKGYSTPDHMRALASLGPTKAHRRTWNLPIDNQGVINER